MVAKVTTKTLTRDEIQSLYQFVNTGREWYIDVNSYKLVDKIIELWFNTQGYDYWENPYPDVIECTATKDKEIIFSYINNN